MCSSNDCGTPAGTAMFSGARSSLHRDLQPPLDLADVLGVGVQGARDRRADITRSRCRLPVM
jgi:hypothetical protein